MVSHPNDWLVLLKLGEQGALNKPLFTSTTVLKKEFNCSQQTVSRWLTDLVEEGLIQRKMALRGEYISITKKGKEELIKLYRAVGVVLESKVAATMMLEGKFFFGMGEGAYYVSKEGYRKQFISKLGFDPYPGTLNLRLTKKEYVAVNSELRTLKGIQIQGFTDGERSYGDIICFPVLINDKIEGAALLIQRTHYDESILEIISPVYLVEALKLSANDTVRVKVYLNLNVESKPTQS